MSSAIDHDALEHVPRKTVLLAPLKHTVLNTEERKQTANGRSVLRAVVPDQPVPTKAPHCSFYIGACTVQSIGHVEGEIFV